MKQKEVKGKKRTLGPSSATLGKGVIYVGDRGSNEVCVVDAATLTGAVVVALGHVNVGLFASDVPMRDRVLEAAKTSGERMWPLPPVFTNLAADALTRLGLELPPETLDLMRYGRGVDNRRLKRAGFQYRYTSAGAVESFARASRLRKTVGDSRPGYKYERDVENFFRRSPAVVKNE